MKPIKIGDNIPDFSLKDQDGNLLKISNYLGKKKLVIFFYPQDGSLNCTREASKQTDRPCLRTGAKL